MTHEALADYMKQRFNFRLLNTRQEGFCFRARTPGSEKGQWRHVIVWLPREEGIRMYKEVVHPMFLRSPSLVLPHYDCEQLWRGHCGQVVDRSGASTSPWVCYPGCVVIDSRASSRGQGKAGLSKKAEELCSDCVFPAARSKVDHGKRACSEGGDVSWTGSPVEYYQAKCAVDKAEVWAEWVGDVGAMEERAKEKKKDKQKKGGKQQGPPPGSWVGQQEPEPTDKLVVWVYLHQRMYYMARGLTRWNVSPLNSVVGYQDRVKLHLGECKGGCCAPWHIGDNTQADNLSRAQGVPSRDPGTGKFVSQPYKQGTM